MKVAPPTEAVLQRRVMISNASIHKIKISGGETAPSWAIILAWPAMLVGIGVIMSSHAWGYLILISLSVFFSSVFGL